jgi:8-oxo-dGTP diphosphatase
MLCAMPERHGLLARGPWEPGQVACVWREDEFEPHREASAAADAAIADLRERGSPSHDGLAVRLADFEAAPDRLELELQPARWSLRLGDDAAASLSAVCVARDTEGRWLAGRRAPWVATWAGRWALGAGGAVELGEHPARTLERELVEEWSVTPERLSVEALVRNPSGLVLLVGLATVTAGAQVAPDDEHDEYAWWPAEVADWPAEADEPLRHMGVLLAG